MDILTDCGCTTHPDQTHEEYMDAFDRRVNRENWEASSKTRLAWYAFCTAEQRRLKENLYHMQQTGRIRVKQ